MKLVKESLDAYGNTEAQQFSQKMYELESQLQGYPGKPTPEMEKAWHEWEASSGAFWQELGDVEDWEDAFKADPMGSIAMMDELKSYVSMFESVNEGSGMENTLWDVFQGDDYGRKVYTLAYVWAKDEKEARELVGEHMDNKEIYTTGFYGAHETSEGELSLKRKQLEHEIAKLTPIN